MVVHREPEQDHEQEHRQPGGDAAGGVEVEQVLAPAPLEDRDEHAVGGRDREQVEQDRLERDDDRAERDQQEQEREQQDEAEHERCRRLHHRVEVVRLGGGAADRVLDAGHGADRWRARARCAASPARGWRPRRCRRRRAGCRRGRRSRRGSSRPGSGSASRRRRAPSPSGRRSPRGRWASSPPLIATTAALAPPGNASSMTWKACSSGWLFGSASSPLSAVWRCSAGSASTISTAAEATVEITGWRRTGRRIAPQKRLPSPLSRRSRCRNGIRPFSTRSPSFESIGRQHRERADHRDGDDHHRADRERHERLVAREQHAGHRDDHGDAGDQHRTAGGGRGGFDRGPLASPGPPLVTLAAEVEERVVDTDGEPDQQDDLVDRIASIGTIWLGSETRPSVANTAVSPTRTGTSAATAEPSTSSRITSVSDEGDQPDLRDPRVDDLVERLLGRDAGLGHVEVRVCLLDAPRWRRRSSRCRARLVVGAVRAERDQRRVAVGRDLTLVARRRAASAACSTSLEARERADRVVDRRAEGGIVDRLRLRLDDHDLARARSRRGRRPRR